jgi:hypothetical protein
MRVTSEISNGLPTAVVRYLDAAAMAARGSIVRATTSLQVELRAQVASAGLGSGLANSWRMMVYPGQASLKAAGMVYSKAPMLITVFNTGVTILPHSGRFLAIPLPGAIAMGFGDSDIGRGNRVVPGGQMRRGARVGAAIARLGSANVWSVPLTGGRQLILYRAPNVTGKGTVIRGTKGRGIGVPRGGAIPLFLLLPQVTLAKRLDVDGAHGRALKVLADDLDSSFGAI